MLSLRLSEKFRAGFAIEAGGIRSQERKCVNCCSFSAAQKLQQNMHFDSYLYTIFTYLSRLFQRFR